MDIPDDILTIFSAEIESDDGPIVRVPDRECEVGDLDIGDRYRIAVLPAVGRDASDGSESTRSRSEASDPPVEEGDVRDVEIEDIGEQGDGISRVERGFVVIVPDTEQGERVKVEITDVGERVAFGEVIERYDQFR